MSIFGGLAALGLGGSVLGGILGSNSAADQARATNAAAEQSRQFALGNGDEYMLRQLAFALGPEEAERMFRGAGIPTDRIDKIFGRAASGPDAGANPGNTARIAQIQQELARLPATIGRGTRDGFAAATGSTAGRRSALEQELRTLQGVNGRGDPGVAPSIDLNAFRAMGPGYLQQLQGLGDEFAGRGQRVMAGYNLDTDRLMRGGDSILAGLEGYGDQERSRIKRVTNEANRDADRRSLAALSGAGLADSTLRANQVSANARRFGEQEQDAQGALSDNLIRLRTGVRQGNLGMLSQRLGGRTGLETSLNDQALSLKQNPITARMQLLSGPVFSPLLGQNTTQYYPGVSPSATFGQGFSSMLAGMGGQASSFGLMGLLAPELRGLFGTR